MQKLSHIQAITLDLDDTLWPVAPKIRGAEQDLLHWLVVNTPETAKLTQRTEVKTQLANEAYAVFDTARQRVTLYEGVKEALARLSTKFRLVAISNGTADVFVTPASPYFQAAFNAHEVGVAKPDVKIYQAATSYLRLDADQVLHVGDDAHTDAWGAREAGLHTVWINPHDHPWTHDSPQPWTIRHLSEVADHFQV